MAVDTKEKRFSMIGFGDDFNMHVIPQGSVGSTSRATLMNLYSGVALDNPSAATSSLLLFNRSIANYGGMRQ